MKYFLQILLFLFFVDQHILYAQPVGIADSIMSIKGKWKKGEAFVHANDPSLQPGRFGLLYKKLDSIAAFFKQAYPVPLGAEAKWYPNISEKPLFEKAPSPYSFWSLYHLYYYNKNLKKILLGDETFTWAYVFINFFNWLLADTKLETDIEGKRKTIWRQPKRLAGDWKGYPLFEAYTHSPNARAIVITKNGMMPWKAVSQMAYLQALKQEKETELTKIDAGYDEGIAKARQIIEDIRNKKDLPASSKEMMIASAQKQIDKLIETREANIKTIQSVIKKDIGIIDNYISNNSAETLQQQAVVNRFQDFIFYKRFEEPSHKDATALVFIDQDYFDKKLPSYEPQFMVLYWRWQNTEPGLYFRKQIEQNFPVEKLQAMIAGNKRAISSKQIFKDNVKDQLQAIINNAGGLANHATTWTKIKNEMELYLTTLWQEGKLAGSKTSEAFLINIGTSSMTASEIQLGKLVAVISVAFMAPGEFETFRFEKQL